ncbi:hypothetical protein [Psychrobacter sp. 72-O-c]|uniref:hypothetical protein n=1 Tax=Psychrobacter sp. 72-O-c TaxID=2774125 RepID=UPI001918C724|nr:hypothetical protein [Psychrobacter sp. 72-O-c]
MKDADNSNTDHAANVNHEAGLSKADYKKPTNNRTSDIYKRFLNRVQGIDSNANISDSDANASNLEANNVESFNRVEKPSAYEPLNEEELLLFTDHERDVDSNESDFTSIDISFSDEDEVIEDADGVTDLSKLSADNELTHSDANLAAEPEVNLSTKSSDKKSGALWDKQVSSGKLLTIGVVCGLLLSGLIVMTLSVTGVLAILSDSLAPNSAQIVPASAPTANSEQTTNQNTTTKTYSSNVDNTNPNNSGIALSTKTANSNTLSADATVNDSKPEMDNTKTVSSKELPAQPISKKNEVKNNSTDNSTENSAVTGIDISPEDFREEAQNTLYRETKD